MPGFGQFSGLTAADALPLPDAAADTPWLATRYLVVVTTADWQACTGELRCFSRTHATAGWQAAGGPVPVMLGRNGLAWGRGLHQPVVGGRQKAEGDGCAPAGVFAITALFGVVADDSPLLAGKMPFLRATPGLLAIDDPASIHYNRIVDTEQIAAPDWRSAETMLRPDDRYLLGAVVAHNGPPAVPGGGSCIFIHVAEAGQPTAGCTALPAGEMAWLAGRLATAESPLLVQLPAATYDASRAAWGWPALPAPAQGC